MTSHEEGCSTTSTRIREDRRDGSMAIEYRFLSEDMKGDIYRTFVDAFSDYAMDMSYMTEEITFNRAEKNGIDLGSSIGAFDGSRMVGYTLVGRDVRGGVSSAFDIGTGIVKPYRGIGIAGGMFERLSDRLREQEVRKFVLEVLQENEPAVKAYTRSGFRIVREFDCFELDLGEVNVDEKIIDRIKIVESDWSSLDEFSDSLDWLPSWENSFESIRRIPDEVIFFTAVTGPVPAGLIVYYPAINWIMTLVVKREYRLNGIGAALVAFLAATLNDSIEKVRLVNVDGSDEGMIDFLKKTGFDLLISQYEMEMDL